MHQRLGLARLPARREYHMACLCHKNIYTENKSGLSDHFTKISGASRTTRYTCNVNMVVPNIHSEKGCKAISYRGPVFWNALNNDIKCIDKFEAFQAKINPKTRPELDNHPT